MGSERSAQQTRGDMERSVSERSEAGTGGASTMDLRDGDNSSTDESSLALRQTRTVRRLRMTFTLVLAAMATGLAVLVFFLTRRDEMNQFEANFEDRATKVIDSFHSSIEQKISALEALSFAITSYASSKDLTWPFVTIPDFEILVGSARHLADAVSIVLYPMVTSDTRDDWEEYSRQNNQWIDTGLQFQEKFGVLTVGAIEAEQATNESPVNGDHNFTYDITVFEGSERVPAPDGPIYFPFWQSSPVSKNMVNLDLHSTGSFAKGIDQVMWTEESLVGRTESKNEFIDDKMAAFRNSWESNEYNPNAPVEKLYFPVFDVLDPDNRHPVGIVTSILFWESFLENTLAPNLSPILATIENECSQAFSYVIIGEDVEFVGEGDLHDEKFEEMKMVDRAFRFAGVSETVQKFKGVPINDFCNFTMTLYPTIEMEDEFLTREPWVLGGVVVGLFAIAALMIYCYDWRVEYNYQLVYRKAKQAGAIVSSIFPAAVRRRMYQEDVSNSMSKSKETGFGAFKQRAPSVVDSQKVRLKGYLNDADENPADMTQTATVSIKDESARRRSSALSWGKNGGNVNGTANGASKVGVEDTAAVAITPPKKEQEKPIADLFPDVTILFADVVGFTAWSSQREPAEVFMLLQTLYHEFDTAARAMHVFKVETIGDCYVAATGIPDPQKDHAVRMAKFASKIMFAMIEVTRQLEVQLGPDTGELRMRIGLHSGAVTAGVLKGAKARFQLFGDTMNMAARMEHNSISNRIQCSEATADLIRASNKGHWIRPRVDKVQAKGKGEVQTYWIVPKSGSENLDSTNEDEDEQAIHDVVHVDSVEDNIGPWGNSKHIFDLSSPNSRYQRLIDWNVELLCGMLKQIEAKRRDARMRVKESAPSMELQGGSTALDEVTDIITLPQFENKKTKIKKKTRPEEVVLSPVVITQLRDYVTTIASMYRDNAFHNFEHASHVTMSTNKLMKRVTVRDGHEHEEIDEKDLHDYTYGITSDPLTQFTLVFCALVHDVDHAGVSNYQLIKEKATIARLYKNKSVAEQNSVDLAWDLLMDPTYKDLQKAIYANEEELKRFRQLMVNIVLATDIFDADMKAVRERRWGKAFQYEEGGDDEEEKMQDLPQKALERDYNAPLSTIESANLKATIVMEHLIQASDVAHTMQHWQIYLKWNERLFNEMYGAFEEGRAEKDPSLVWYEGEIMFFDKYIIPLAKKLDDCGVFGVSSDECLNYATQNRKQWAYTGDQIIEGMLRRYKERKEEAAKGRKVRRESA